MSRMYGIHGWSRRVEHVRISRVANSILFFFLFRGPGAEEPPRSDEIGAEKVKIVCFAAFAFSFRFSNLPRAKQTTRYTTSRQLCWISPPNFVCGEVRKIRSAAQSFAELPCVNTTALVIRESAASPAPTISEISEKQCRRNRPHY